MPDGAVTRLMEKSGSADEQERQLTKPERGGLRWWGRGGRQFPGWTLLGTGQDTDRMEIWAPTASGWGRGKKVSWCFVRVCIEFVSFRIFSRGAAV